MAVAHRASAASGSTNPTTTFTVVLPSSVVAGDVCYVQVTSRDHTSGTAYPTVTDNDTGGNTWTRIAESTDRKATLWRKFATSGTASKTVTVAGCVGSSSGGVAVYSGADQTTPNTTPTVEDNASGNETHAEITPSVADAMICLGVFNTGNDNAVATEACTTPGALTERWEKLSTGGSDCACVHASALQSGGPTATGAFTWAQTDGTTKSIVWAVQPPAPLSGNGTDTGTLGESGKADVVGGGTETLTTGESVVSGVDLSTSDLLALLEDSVAGCAASFGDVLAFGDDAVAQLGSGVDVVDADTFTLEEALYCIPRDTGSGSKVKLKWPKAPPYRVDVWPGWREGIDPE